MFGFDKKKEQVRKNTSCRCGSTPAPEPNAIPDCACNGNAAEYIAGEGCCSNRECGIRSIRVLGSGCKSCHDLYEACIAAAAELGIALEVEYITDMEKIMSYGVMSMPALVINDKVISMGKVMNTAALIKLLKKLGYC